MIAVYPFPSAGLQSQTLRLRGIKFSPSGGRSPSPLRACPLIYHSTPEMSVPNPTRRHNYVSLKRVTTHGRHTAAVLFVDVGCYELSAEITEVALEMAQRGGPATVQLGLAMLGDLVVVSS